MRRQRKSRYCVTACSVEQAFSRRITEMMYGADALAAAERGVQGNTQRWQMDCQCLLGTTDRVALPCNERDARKHSGAEARFA